MYTSHHLQDPSPSWFRPRHTHVCVLRKRTSALPQADTTLLPREVGEPRPQTQADGGTRKRVLVLSFHRQSLKAGSEAGMLPWALISLAALSEWDLLSDPTTQPPGEENGESTEHEIQVHCDQRPFIYQRQEDLS